MTYICDICGKLHFLREKPLGPLQAPLVHPCHGSGMQHLIEVDDRFATQLQKMHWYKQIWRKKKRVAEGAKRRYNKRKAKNE